MLALPKAEPPEVPFVVAHVPDAAIDVKIASTLVAVSDVQPSHAKSKTPFAMPVGFQFEKTSAEKSVSDVQPNHALCALEKIGSAVSKLVSELQVSHARNTLVAKGSSELNETRS